MITKQLAEEQQVLHDFVIIYDFAFATCDHEQGGTVLGLHNHAKQSRCLCAGHKNASSPSARRLPNSTHFPVRVQPALSQTSSPAPPDGFPSDDVAAVDGHQSGTNHADALDSSAAVTPQSRSDEQQQPSHSADDIDQPSSSVTDRQETGNVPQDAQTKAQRKRKPRTAWPAVQKPAAGSSGSVLVDQYSSPISDSEDSDAEAAQQPLLKHLTAISIQSSECFQPQSAAMCCGMPVVLCRHIVIRDSMQVV